MSERIMLITSFDIHPGRLAAFKDAIAKAVAFARDHGPQLLVEVYIDDVAMRAHSFQIQPDPAAILRHWQMAEPHIAAVMDCCSMTGIEIFGTPGRAVLDGMEPLARERVRIRITPGFTGFASFPDEIRAGSGAHDAPASPSRPTAQRTENIPSGADRA